MSTNGDSTIKLKRQVRDYFNKNVHDRGLITKVAKLIGYKKEKQND